MGAQWDGSQEREQGPGATLYSAAATYTGNDTGHLSNPPAQGELLNAVSRQEEYTFAGVRPH